MSSVLHLPGMIVQTVLLCFAVLLLLAAAWWSRRAQMTTARLLAELQRRDQERQEERQGLEAAQEILSDRWRTLLQTTEDAILIADPQGQVVLSNPHAARLFARQTLADREPSEQAAPRGALLAFTLSSEIDDLYRQARRRAAPVEADVILAQPAGRTLRARIAPISSDEYLISLRDLTELRRLERIRRDFVANVSHELRTPLTSIKAMAETLMDGALMDEKVATRFLDTIVRESDRLVRLSSDLLDLSRVEARGIEKVLIDLAELIAEVTGRMVTQADDAGIVLVNTVVGPLTVPLDRDEMSRVLVNLLDNAIKYTPRGGRVTVTAQDGADAVSVSVTDTGIGILSHDIPRLFERFYRVDKARSRASGGTGLGLSIVKHIVESHEGSVSVESEYNKGTALSFTLPKA